MTAESIASWIAWLQPPVLAVQAGFLVVLAARALPVMVREIRPPRGTILAVAAASGLSLFLAAAVAPRTARIYFDEQIYGDVAHNITALGMAQMCTDGRIEAGELRCLSSEYNKEPAGFPFLVSVAYRIAGVDDRAGTWVNNALAAFLPWVVFFAVALLLRDPAAGAYGALAVAMIPQHAQWSNTGAAEPSAAFFTAVAVTAVVGFCRQRSTELLALATVAVAFAAHFRPESIAVLPLAVAIVWLVAPSELSTRRFRLACGAVVVLCGVLAGHVWLTAGHGWDAPGPRFALGYLRDNVPVNARYFIADPRFPYLFGALAAIGVAGSAAGRARAVLPLYAATFWLVFACFYAGSYNFGANVRYAVVTHPAVAMLAGAGASVLAQALARLRLSAGVAAAAVAIAIAAQLPLWWRDIGTIGTEGLTARQDVAFSREAIATLPERSLVITHVPSMFLTWGRSATQAFIAARQPEYVRALAREFPGGVYLHWGYWCNAPVAVQRGFCDAVLAAHPYQLVRENATGPYRYALYRLEGSGTGR